MDPQADRAGSRKRALTIKDVARVAGVSVGTVSRVLHANSRVGEKLRIRVQKAIDDLGYVPDAVAQSMRIGITHTIGCVLREINIPVLGAFVKAAHDVLDEAGFSLVITNSEGRRDREFELLRRMSRRQTDGAMIGPYTPIAGDFEAFLKDLPIPIVLIDRDVPPWLDAVMADHAHGTRVAAQHLLKLGHRRIAIITGPNELYPARERLRGYKEAFDLEGLQPDPSLVLASSFVAGAGFRHTSSMLAHTQRPTAIIAGGMDMLSGVLRAIRARGLRVPEDISIVASSDSELAELYRPPIGVVRWDLAEVGRVAAELLLDRIKNRAAPLPRHVLLPTEFTARQSIGPSPTRQG
ncbi:MAG: substrate-binding domain-containing protein [Hyphomonadaceae bacterium]|nr:substrate-binding domain-containing protein [Hyphomonadaceae bacterium]